MSSRMNDSTSRIGPFRSKLLQFSGPRELFCVPFLPLGCMYLFLEIVAHLEEAVWAEMTTELKGIFKESNNHSTHIY